MGFWKTTAAVYVGGMAVIGSVGALVIMTIPVIKKAIDETMSKIDESLNTPESSES